MGVWDLDKWLSVVGVGNGLAIGRQVPFAIDCSMRGDLRKRKCVQGLQMKFSWKCIPDLCWGIRDSTACMLIQNLCLQIRPSPRL